MRIRSRLVLLERTTRERVIRAPKPKPLPTDDQEADLMGILLWMTPDGVPHNRGLATDPQKADEVAAFRAWDLALRAARAEGHDDYHVGMRAQAMAVWIAMKPELLEFQRVYRR
jgi:hypothetical protein